MQIGCFALVEPFTPMERQFAAIAEMGIRYADVTDSHDGASLGVEFGFSATISLDGHPAEVREMASAQGITLTAVCAHANLLDPVGPARYQSAQIIKAVRLARDLGVGQVISTEGDPKTGWGHRLSPDERLTLVRSQLYEPIRWAKELGIELLLEPHGVMTDSIDGMAQILDAVDRDQPGGAGRAIGVNLDTGNLWLGGGDPVAFVRHFGDRIRHVHWKDMGEEWVPKRGTLYGCGMALIALGDGVVEVPSVVQALKAVGFDGPTTLEIAGPEAVKLSAARLKEWWGPGAE